MASNNFKTSFNKGRLGIGLSKSENNGDPRYALEVNGNIKITGAILDKDGFNYAEVHELPTHLLNNGPISYPNVNDMEENESNDDDDVRVFGHERKSHLGPAAMVRYDFLFV